MTFMKHVLAVSVALAGVSPVALFAPGVALAQDVSECACVTAFQGQNMSVGKIVATQGDVRISQAAGYAVGEKDAALSIGSRIMVGPKSSAQFQVGSTCNISVTQNATADISRVQDNICVKLLMPEVTASYGQQGPDGDDNGGTGGVNVPLVMFGIAATTALATTIVEAIDDDTCASPPC